MSSVKDTFIRSFELESRRKALRLYQQKIGDVSCVVWDAALVLAKYLDLCCHDDKFGANWLVDKRIVELGAGIGCVGMTAACLGCMMGDCNFVTNTFLRAHVVITDLESTLPILKRNIELNEDRWENSGGSVCAEILEWGNEVPPDLSPDIILLADCVYYMESIRPLLKTLELLCERNPGAFAILSQEERDTPGQIQVWEKFMHELKNKFKIELIPISEQHPTYSSEDIHLMKLTRK